MMVRSCSAALVVVALLVGGCSSSEEESPSGAVSGSTEATVDPDEHDHADDLHVASPTTAPEDRQDPVVAARRFLEAWSRPDLPYREWWRELEPLLNPQGRQAYEDTDPAVVPRLELTGKPEVEKSGVATSAIVWMPTDQGRFGIRLSRVSAHSEWLVSRVYFPGNGP